MTDLLPPNIGHSEPDLNDHQVAATRWLRLAVDNSRLLPKEVYIELQRDKSAFSRWSSYEDEHTIPLGDVLQALPLFAESAVDDLIREIRLAATKKPR